MAKYTKKERLILERLGALDEKSSYKHPRTKFNASQLKSVRTSITNGTATRISLQINLAKENGKAIGGISRYISPQYALRLLSILEQGD